jgi:hypothetical protein
MLNRGSATVLQKIWLLLTALMCAVNLLSCQKPSPGTASTTPHSVDSTETAPLSLNLYLTDAAHTPQTHLSVSWRPVFAAPDSSLGSVALSDEAGHLTASQLLPGVRYLFSTSFAGHTVQQWYRVPTSSQTDSNSAWQWVLGENVLQEDVGSEDLARQHTPPLNPERLHYLPGMASAFQSALAVAAAQMEILPLKLSDLRPSSDLVWWVSGDFDAEPGLLDSAALDALEHFVFQGGTLVINGEWAGLNAGLQAQTQALGQRLGFMVSQDTLAQSETRLTVENIHRHWLTHNVKSLVLSRSGSVRVYNPQATQELAFAGAEHYRIASLEEQHTVLAVLAYGQGTVIALGDSSLWSESLFKEKDNRQLWENILSPADEASVTLP